MDRKIQSAVWDFNRTAGTWIAGAEDRRDFWERLHFARTELNATLDKYEDLDESEFVTALGKVWLG